MRQLMLVTVLLGFLVSGTAIFLGDAFLVAKPDGGETGFAGATGTLGLMQWLAAGAARLNVGKGGTAGPGFRLPPGAATPSSLSNDSSKPFLTPSGSHSGSRDQDDGLSPALPAPTSMPGGSVPPSQLLDPETARQALSASSGDVNAEYRLGLAYRDGKGAPTDPVAASHWLAAAASSGLPQAQIALAALFEAGTGVSRDAATAYVWYDRAASSSAAPFVRDFAQKERDRLAATMSAGELAKARRQAVQ